MSVRFAFVGRTNTTAFKYVIVSLLGASKRSNKNTSSCKISDWE